MAKAKVTRKWLNENYYCCAAGYADLQYLFHNVSPDYYTCGAYGWNMDAYVIDGYCVTTGYRGMINNCKNHYTYSLGREYNERARKIVENHSDFTTEGYNEQLTLLQKEFITKVFKE